MKAIQWHRTAAAVLVAALLLTCAACGGKSKEPPTESVTTTSAATETHTTTTEAPTTTTAQTTVPTTTTTKAPEAFTVKLAASTPIYDRPDRDGTYLRSVAEYGTYTIVEQSVDGNGNVWGRLKSGLGWVLLEVNLNIGGRVCSRCGTTDDTAFLSDWKSGDMCMMCIRDEFHFGEDGGLYCPQCGTDCSYRGLEDNGLCEDCNGY